MDSLKGSLKRNRDAKAPLLVHLNADTTWLLSLPYPDQFSPPPGRLRYNVLIDPWLDGPQADVASWFSKQWHLHKSSVQTIRELNECLCETEGHAQEHHDDRGDKHLSFIDTVVVSHEFTDHCHQATLLEMNPEVPVFATTKAARLIRTWNHFDKVIEMPKFVEGTDWRTTNLPPLPSWIGISRIVTGSDALYYHSAIVICAQQTKTANEQACGFIYTPHGVEASSLSVMATASPEIDIRAFLHGLHDVSLKWSKQLNLGAVNAVKAQKMLHAKFWIGTHDEQKPGAGLIAPLIRRKIWTVQEAIAQVQALEKGSSGEWAEDINCLELGNGESLLLE